ncbi:MAG: TonB-dependent receptor [Phycisphaerales bacterium]|nr:TonB-dependent receptor [Phycisphaerales bacterium]
MNRKKIFICSLISLCCSNVFAQSKAVAPDTTIKGTTIEITQIYQPQVKQAVKQEYSPILPPVDYTAPKFEYQVPGQLLNYSYKPIPLQPLSLDRDTPLKFFENYVKVGLGNLHTIYLDAGIGGIKTKKIESNVQLGFLSQQGSLAYQKQTLGSLNAEAIYKQSRLSASFALHAIHNNFFQYGYDQVLFPTRVPTRQALTGGQLSISLKRSITNDKAFLPELKTNLSYYTGNNISNEFTYSLGIFTSKKIDENWATRLGLESVNTKLNSEFYSVNNSYASLSAGLDYHRNNFNAHAFLIPTIGQNSNAYLLHDISLKLNIMKHSAILGVGALGELSQNTYRQLFLRNPYISQFPSVQTHSNELFAFAEKGLGHHLFFSAKLSWWQYEHFAVFTNSQTVNSEKMMVAYLDKLNALSAQLGMRYQISNAIAVGVQLSVFKYYNILGSNRVWQTPNTQLNANVSWNPLPKLNINAYGSFLAGNYALDSASKELKLNPILDLGFGAEYLVLKKLSLFLNCNNLLNNKYERWWGYQSYGINIFGGVRLKF